MKKFRIVDLVILLAVAAALVVGFLTYKHLRQTADKQIESTQKIAFQVYLRGVTITSGFSPVKPGDETFISIRNVPYTALKVIDVKIDSKKVIMPTPGAKQPFTLMEDYSQMFMYDIIVTVIDTAKITKDGAVVGGNKVKIGLPITLEGPDYKLNGTVSNVQVITPEQVKMIDAQLQKIKNNIQQQQKTAVPAPKQGTASTPSTPSAPVNVK